MKFLQKSLIVAGWIALCAGSTLAQSTADPVREAQRLMARGLTEGEADQRLAAQMPAHEKATRADYVIDTNGSFEDTERQVAGTLTALGERAGE